MIRISKFTQCWVFATAVLLSAFGTNAKTAVVFGATGAVGNEVLKSILRDKDDGSFFFDEVILVGRREFPPKVTNLLPPSTGLPRIVSVVHKDLTTIDHNQELSSLATDACFVAVGAGSPQLLDLSDWYDVEVTATGAMTRLCESMGAKSISLLSAITTEDAPEPYSEKELTKTGTPLGWWSSMGVNYPRIMGLKEKAVEKDSEQIPSVRIFRPSSIITEELRYGWVDWTIFKVHAIIDPIVPAEIHSVTTKLLGNAMVKDAESLLSEEETTERTVTRLTYGDYVRIVGEEGVHNEL
jgi:hypothetical protein